MKPIEQEEIISRFLDPDEKLLWHSQGLKRRKKSYYQITTKRIFSITKWGSMVPSSFPCIHYIIIQHFTSDIECFYSFPHKKPQAADLAFKTRPISWLNNRLWLLLVTHNKELPPDHPYYVQFILDNGWSYISYKPTCWLIEMHNVAFDEHLRSILINELKILQGEYQGDHKQLIKELKSEDPKLWVSDFHTTY